MGPVAGSRRSWGLVAALGLAAFVKTACDGGEDSGPSPVDDALLALLTDVGPEVVRPALDRVAVAAEAFEAAAVVWHDAEVADGESEAAQLAAQEAWWALMEAWQEVELLQLGPAASSLTAVAGADLRDEVYSWPTVNRCRVDQVTVEANWNEADFFEVSLVNVIGLDALEVLLYSPAGENACPSQVDINADGTWDALGVDGVAEHRAAYAVALAAHLSGNVDSLVASWDPAGGDFGGQLATAGEADSPYESATEALNAVFDAAFYLETVTKDRKLGYAVGEGDCEGSSCIDGIESPIAGGSHVWIAVNLRAFRTLFTGGAGAGMDDLLRSLGEGELADAVLAALDQADLAAAALTGPLDEVVAADPAPAEALYAAVKTVTDLLKGDIATVLALQIPSEAAGDAD